MEMLFEIDSTENREPQIGSNCMPQTYQKNMIRIDDVREIKEVNKLVIHEINDYSFLGSVFIDEGVIDRVLW